MGNTKLPQASYGRGRWIGGWLWLPILELCISTYILPWLLFRRLAVLGWASGPAALSDLAQYEQVFISFELIAFPFLIYSLALLIRKSHYLPKFMVIFYAVRVLYIASAFPAGLVMAVPLRDIAPAAWFKLAYVLLSCTVWVPYFRLSKRVRDTFVA